MKATVGLDEYLRSNKLRKGQALTYVHWDTGFPVPVAFVRKSGDPKKIRVERLFDNPLDNCVWTVDISACSIQITV
jgi:hypothetical protein